MLDFTKNNEEFSSFDNLYEEEGRTLITEFYGEADVNYWLEDETEYWCQAFQTVRVANEQVSGVAPKTYAYFADIFNQLYSEKSAKTIIIDTGEVILEMKKKELKKI